MHIIDADVHDSRPYYLVVENERGIDRHAINLVVEGMFTGAFPNLFSLHSLNFIVYSFYSLLSYWPIHLLCSKNWDIYVYIWVDIIICSLSYITLEFENSWNRMRRILVSNEWHGIDCVSKILIRQFDECIFSMQNQLEFFETWNVTSCIRIPILVISNDSTKTNQCSLEFAQNFCRFNDIFPYEMCTANDSNHFE